MQLCILAHGFYYYNLHLERKSALYIIAIQRNNFYMKFYFLKQFPQSLCRQKFVMFYLLNRIRFCRTELTFCLNTKIRQNVSAQSDNILFKKQKRDKIFLSANHFVLFISLKNLNILSKFEKTTKHCIFEH